MFRVLLALLILAGLCVPPSFAEEFPRPMVDYRADTIMKAEQRGGDGPMTIPGKVYFSQGKERREMEMMGRTSVLIQRPDLKLTWMLMPEQRMYMEYAKVPTNQHQDPADNWKNARIEKTRLGSETVNGVATEKYKIVATAADGSTSNGFVWLTKENIPMRIEGEGTAEGQKTSFFMECSNLKTGALAAELFEVPTGYTRFQTGGFGAGYTPGPPVGTMQPDAPAGGMGGMSKDALQGLPPALRQQLEKMRQGGN